MNKTPKLQLHRGAPRLSPDIPADGGAVVALHPPAPPRPAPSLDAYEERSAARVARLLGSFCALRREQDEELLVEVASEIACTGRVSPATVKRLSELGRTPTQPGGAVLAMVPR